jgi:hypothetical protein
LREELSAGTAEKVGSAVIYETAGLPKEERKAVIEKAAKKEWGERKVREYVSTINKNNSMVKDSHGDN